MEAVSNTPLEPDFLARVRKREPGALARLYTLYYPRILKYVHYRLGPEEAEDVTGEVFLKLLNSIDTQSGNFEAWLYRLARNAVIDRVRHRNTRREEPLREEAPDPTDQGRGAHSTTAALDVERALSLVGEEHRELLVLRFIQGLSAAEIGEITGQSPGAVRGMLFRALTKLRMVLDPKEVRE